MLLLTLISPSVQSKVKIYLKSMLENRFLLYFFLSIALVGIGITNTGIGIIDFTSLIATLTPFRPKFCSSNLPLEGTLESTKGRTVVNETLIWDRKRKS